jgi:hypothetical protein
VPPRKVVVAYYLLDTDEEKFALFFERSNSKGIQLNFIDILAAKLYAGFNAKIEEFEDANPALELNREVLVRAISFHVSQGKDIGRNYILSTLSHPHFNEHWDKFASTYKRSRLSEDIQASHSSNLDPLREHGSPLDGVRGKASAPRFLANHCRAGTLNSHLVLVGNILAAILKCRANLRA